MRMSLQNYRRYSFVVLFVFILLVVIQVNWLHRLISLQNEELHQKMQRLIPDIALDINSIDHLLFRSKGLLIDSLPMQEMILRFDSIIEINGIQKDTYFAIYQDTTNGIFICNKPEYKQELLKSDIKSCISCIHSFSIVKDTLKHAGETDDEYYNRLLDEAEPDFYSYVNNINLSNGETIWISIYQPKGIANATKPLILLFFISILLLILLLYNSYLLNQSLSKHKKLDQMKDDFFNNMTHEFKTPLGAIRLASKVLRQSNDKERNESYHQIIEKESKWLEVQMDRLLELSLFDNEELKLDLEKVDLHKIIQDIPDRLNHLLLKKKANVKMDLKLKGSIVDGDLYHLSNSLYNIVENSLKYSQKEVKILISTEEEQGKKVIKIKDNGPGIELEKQAFIFDRFYRANKNNQYKGQGFGIGLSYVKSIIEIHKGNVRINSDYKDGCEFIIVL